MISRHIKYSFARVVAYLLLCAAITYQAAAQDVSSLIRSMPVNYTLADVSLRVDQFYRDNPGVSGRKQWERWKWYAERHLDADGKVANITQRTMQALQQMNISATHFGSATNPAGANRLNGDWNPIGPFAIAAPAQNYLGRVNCVAFHPTDVNTIFVGTPGGGLWKSTTGGTSWTPLTDGLPSSGISGIAINPSNASIMYLLTGDGNGGPHWGYYVKENGCGVYKSTDGGITWSTTGLSWQQSEIKYGYKLLIHPTNPSILLAATSDGIYRTIDGGAIWTQEIAGEFQDIEFKANDPTRLCATRYGVASLYVSANTGDTWVAKAYPGASGITRGEVEVSDANTGLAWVLLGPQGTGTFRGLYTYNWASEVFTLITDTPNLFTGQTSGTDNGGFPWWAIGLWVSPTNANNMLMGGVIGRRSTTGGSTWVADNDILHADSHGYFTNPLNNEVFAVNDGGIFKSSNSGDTWTNITGNLQVTQYYRMSGVDANTNILLAGAQDNGHHLRTINTTTYNHVITCCDGMDNGINYSNTAIMYGFTQYGGLNKSTNGGSTFFGIFPDIASGGEPWVVPFLVHTTTPTTIFYSSVNGLLRHTASGEPTSGWTNLGGGGGTTDFAMGTSNTDRGYIASAGTIRRTDNLSNAAPTWTLKSGNPGWPSLSGTSITSLDVNPDNSLEIWVTFSGYNAAVKVVRSVDGGENWTNETDNLPNVPVHVIKFQDTNGAPGGAVYIGTDIGVFYRDDVNTSNEWVMYGNDLPKTMVTDMEISEAGNVITVCTYGRGFWRSSLFSGCDVNLSLTTSMSGNQYHQASSTITVTGNVTGGAGTQVFFKSNGTVVFNPGFEVKAGNEMKAFIGPCDANTPVFRLPSNPEPAHPVADTLKKQPGILPERKQN